MKVAYWIQGPDYESTEFPPVPLEVGAAALRAHDWEAELEAFRRMEAAGDDCCPPGIGFVRPAAPGAEFLHACPQADGGWSVFYQHPERGTDASAGADGLTLAGVEALLATFYSGGRHDVEQALGRLAR